MAVRSTCSFAAARPPARAETTIGTRLAFVTLAALILGSTILIAPSSNPAARDQDIFAGLWGPVEHVCDTLTTAVVGMSATGERVAGLFGGG